MQISFESSPVHLSICMNIYLLEYKFMTRVDQRSTPRSCREITFGHASPTWCVLFLSHYKWSQARSPNPDFQCRIWPTRLLTRKQALRPSSNSRMHSLTYTSREHAFVKHTDSQSIFPPTGSMRRVITFQHNARRAGISPSLPLFSL